MAIKLVRDQVFLAAGEEVEWTGGSGTLHSTGNCTLKVRTANQAKGEEVSTTISVTAANTTQNFTLGTGLILSLSAAGSIHPVRDASGYRGGM